MTTRQLLVRSSPGGVLHLDAVESSDDVPVGEYEDLDRGVAAPNLGSDGLLTVASFLLTQGYSILEIDLRDSDFRPFPEDLDAELQSLIVSRLRRSPASVKFVDSLIEGYGLVVVSLTARLRHSNEYLTVTRDGQIRGSFRSVDRILDDLGSSLGIARSQ